VTDSVGTRFVLLAGGRFVQGTSGGEAVLKKSFPLSTTGQFFGNAEEPAHVTWITRPFYIAETEVTLAQFKAFVEATQYRTSAEQAEAKIVGWQPTSEDAPLYESSDFLRDEKFNWKNAGFIQSDDHPVVGVSWVDAKAYCEWLSKNDGVAYRLPTEAEWEFACRAGTDSWFSFGDVARETIHRHANIGNAELEKHRKHSAERQWLLDWENSPEDGHVFTAPVGGYEANSFGLKDMHGNVWEWCEDLWLDTIYKDFSRPAYNRLSKIAVDPVNNDRPQTPTNEFHTIRGGSWYNGDLICRSANRSYWDGDDAACYIGFRVVREADVAVSTKAKQDFDEVQTAIGRIEAAGGQFYSSRGLDVEVRFDGENLDESALNSLKQIPNLQGLRINWRQRNAVLTQSGIDSIADLPELQSLDFANAVDAEHVDLSVLTKLPKLTSLKFSRSVPLRDNQLRALSQLTTLTVFQCYGTNGGITDAGVSSLRGNRGLESLELWENQATGSFLQDFVGCPLMTFASTRIYNGEPTLADENAERLAGFSYLKSVTLDGQSRLSFPAMRAIGKLPKLISLSLEGCTGFADDDFSSLAGLQSLQQLDLRNTNAGNMSAAAIAEIPRIRSVRISGNRLSDQGIADLAKAISLTELELGSNSITDAGIQSLGYINQLRELTIASENVTGSGFGPIARLPNLIDLKLMTPGLTDVAFDHLSRAKSVQKMRLAVQGTRPPAALTDVGVLKMANATWLKELWLPRNDTSITEQAIEELRTLMPKTGVIPYTVNWK